MARQIGKMLNAREPKIVNGPQILDKYVGESEANVRRLFAEAEEEEKRVSHQQCCEQHSEQAVSGIFSLNLQAVHILKLHRTIYIVTIMYK